MTRKLSALGRTVSRTVPFLLLGVIAAVPARAADVTNLNAPSATETTDSTNPLIVVRRQNGASVCMIKAKGTAWDCSLGAPPGGIATGPSVTVMPKTVSPGGPVKWTFVFVRSGNGGFYERHQEQGQSTWSPWSTGLLGGPPAGVTASSGLVASHGRQSMSVAFRATNNIVWVKIASAGLNDVLPSFGSWMQAPADNTSSAPAPAHGDWISYVFALGPTAQVRYSSCGFPNCYGPWSFVPYTTKTFNEGIQTSSSIDPESGTTLVKMVATSNGTVWFATMDMTSGQASGFAQYLSPVGRAADSAPAIVPWLTFVHMNNGQWWKLDMFGPTWSQLPTL